ncbi:MAG: hypothetical protein WBC35_18065 [Saprospiraceae bacterium]
MGILDPLKKLLFGVKGVTKHQAGQAIDYTKEKGEELMDKTVEMMKDAGDKIGKTGAFVLDKVDDLWEKKADPFSAEPPKTKSEIQHTAADYVEPIKKKMEEVGDKVADSLSKAKDQAKEIGGKVVEASDDFWKKAETYSENVVEKARAKGSDLFEKAKTVAEEQSKALNQKIDEFIEKGKAIEAKEPKGDFAETPITENKNLTEPLMSKHEDFFDKAKKFLDDADRRSNPKPVEVEAKKVVPPPGPEEKPLDPKDQRQLNDLLSNGGPDVDDHIEDVDIVEDVPTKE